MSNDVIGGRLKENYELRQRYFLLRRVPVIMRLDGNAFHTVTRNFNKPFDENFSQMMINTAKFLCSKIQGAKCAYTQSDEISILITDFDRLATDAWFNYEISNMESISAGMASAYFSLESAVGSAREGILNYVRVFDSRARNYPKEEVCNYFHWRQLDWIRNSLLMYTGSFYSHKEMQNKKQNDMHEMLHDKGVNWADLSPKWKNGTFIRKEEGVWADSNPRFNLGRYIIDDFLIPEEE